MYRANERPGGTLGESRDGERPLEELRVVEMDLIAGPFCGQLHHAVLENIVEVDDPGIGRFPMRNVFPHLTGTPGGVRRTGPALGRHDDEVYGGLPGIGEGEREKPREGGIG